MVHWGHDISTEWAMKKTTCSEKETWQLVPPISTSYFATYPSYAIYALNSCTLFNILKCLFLGPLLIRRFVVWYLHWTKYSLFIGSNFMHCIVVFCAIKGVLITWDFLNTYKFITCDIKSIFFSMDVWTIREYYETS